MARVALGAKIAPAGPQRRDARDDRDAVIALLSVDRDMLIAELAELAAGKIARRDTSSPAGTARRACVPQKARDEIDAQPHRIDVPGRDGKCHARPHRSRRATFPVAGCERKGAPAHFPQGSAASSSPAVARQAQALVDVEQRRVRLCRQVDVEQGDDRLEALRVDHRPLLEREGRGVENERNMRRAAKRRLVLDLDRDGIGPATSAAPNKPAKVAVSARPRGQADAVQ